MRLKREVYLTIKLKKMFVGVKKMLKRNNLILLSLIFLTFELCVAAPFAANESETNAPDLRVDESELSQYVADKEEHSQAEEADANSNNAKGIFKISLLPEPKKTAESVNLETEGIPSKILSSYDITQQKVSDFSQPLPILDTINEHEKYGNNGDMFDGVSRALVNGYEAFSNFLNTLIQKPKDLARSISKGITAQLDIIGGKIVGL